MNLTPLIFFALSIMKKIKRIALFTLFLDTLGLTIIIPVLPDLVGYYHTSYFMISLWLTLYSLFALLSTPILGALSDKFWRKPILGVSVFSSFLSFIILRISWNVRIYLVARIVNGLAGGNISSIQSILSDIAVDQKERTNNFWLFGAIFGIGFIVGPAIGALLLSFGIKRPFIISAILSWINLLLIMFWLPETNKFLNTLKKIKINIVHIFKDMFVTKEKKYYLVFFVVNLAILIYQMSFTLFLNQRFGLSGVTSWYVLAWFGVIMAINQWFLLKSFWLKKFSDKMLVSISILWMMACYAGAFFFSTVRPIIFFVALSWIFQWIFRPVFQNIILWDNKDIGLINGNMSALMNLANIFWPLFGWYLIDLGMSPFGAVAALLLLTYIYSKKYLHRCVA